MYDVLMKRWMSPHWIQSCVSFARNSQVDVVQSVGRVMRCLQEKYGYIIIPVVVPADVAPSEALNDNKRFQVVWSVLNALRAHDDRFNATINKIELNKKRPEPILVGTVARGMTELHKFSDVNRQFPCSSNNCNRCFC